MFVQLCYSTSTGLACVLQCVELFSQRHRLMCTDQSYSLPSTEQCHCILQSIDPSTSFAFLLIDPSAFFPCALQCYATAGGGQTIGSDHSDGKEKWSKHCLGFTHSDAVSAASSVSATKISNKVAVACLLVVDVGHYSRIRWSRRIFSDNVGCCHAHTGSHSENMSRANLCVNCVLMEMNVDF